MTPNFALFDTPIGPCALVWREHGPIGTLLPGPSAAATRSRVRRRHSDATEAAPAAGLHVVIGRMQRLLDGHADDLADIELDTRGVPAFDRSVYDIARRIPPGTTRSYGDIARELGNALAAREVGRALGANPFPIIVPCHRVLAAGHRPGGFSAPGGMRTKLKLLEIERAPLGGTPGLFD